MIKINKYSIFLLAIVILSSCGKKGKGEQPAESNELTLNTVEMTSDQMRNSNIQMGKLELKQITGTIKVNGMLDAPPQQKVSISLPYGGFLKSTGLLQGMKVNQGQVVATIENPDFIQVEQDFLDVESQLEFAKAEYERQQTLAGQNVNATKTFQQAKSNYLSLLARYNGLEAKLKLMNVNVKEVQKGNFSALTNVYSPISGYVTKVNANIGMFLNSTDVLFEIVNTKQLHAELTIFEKDIPKLRIGQKVKFVLANENRERTATIFLIGREIKDDRTVNVHCDIDEPDAGLIPGTFLNAYIETGADKVNALPDDAIVKYQGKNYIFIQEKGTPGKDVQIFTMIEIETGNSDNGYTEIFTSEKTDLKNASIVVKGAYDLLSKMKNI